MNTLLYVTFVYMVGMYLVANITWAIVIYEHFGWNYDNFRGFTEKFICPLYLFIGILFRRRTSCSALNLLQDVL